MTTKEQVLQLLQSTEEALSGQEMSRRLGVSRAAVWKVIEQLRQEGHAIEAATNRGYRLTASPDALDKTTVLRYLGEHPWAQTLNVLDTVDSTNNYAKRLAADGAPGGTVVLANQQTGGRGRRGRSFVSPPDVGVYLSVILRPQVQPEQILHLTALSAVAVCNAIESACGVRPGIKWTNDLVIDKRKMTGILTELSLLAESREVDYVIVGIGVNCNQTTSQFPQELRDMATSLAIETGAPICRAKLAATMIAQLDVMNEQMFFGKDAWLWQFADDCVTIGQDVRIVRGDSARYAHVDGIDGNAALLVTYDDGTTEAVSSGEVSVRGMYGYV